MAPFHANQTEPFKDTDANMDDEGFEPSTFRMQNGRSTTELNALVSSCWCKCIFRSIEVSIPACHAGDPGSIPGGRDFVGAHATMV